MGKIYQRHLKSATDKSQSIDLKIMNEKIKTKKAPINYKKALTRLMAVQILYQYDFLDGEKKIDEVKNDVVENYLLNPELDACSFRDEIDENFLNTLLTGVALDTPKIDSEITEFLRDGWTIEKIEDVSRQILRFGTFELKFMHDIPAKVVLDQYVDIAASFFDSGKITFINATLDAVAKKFRGEEFLSK